MKQERYILTTPVRKEREVRVEQHKHAARAEKRPSTTSKEKTK